jgi:hypothetical protein
VANDSAPIPGRRNSTIPKSIVSNSVNPHKPAHLAVSPRWNAVATQIVDTKAVIPGQAMAWQWWDAHGASA